jgi:hypothetical protein
VFLIHQRLTSPSQGEAVKSMGNFEAQTPLLDTNTQKKIPIPKKKYQYPKKNQLVK